MENKLKNEVCTCGRASTHCRSCGSRSVYVKKFRSLDLSVAEGRSVTVIGCRRCTNETSDLEPCKAPSVNKTEVSFVPFQKKEQLPAWGLAVPGTNEHLRLLNEWITEHQQSNGWDRIQVYVEAQKAGWHLEAYDMEDDVKVALMDLGLLCHQGKTETEDTMRGETGAVATEKPPSSPKVTEGTVISLDEIIQRMQETKQ